MHWSFHWSKNTIQPLALFGAVSQSFSDAKYRTYQSYQFHQPQQRVLVVIFSKGVHMTKPSVQQPSLTREHISNWSLASTVEWNGSLMSVTAFTLQENLAHCHEAQARIHIWMSLLWGLHCLPRSNSHIQAVLPSLGADVPLDSRALFHELPNPFYSSSFQLCRYSLQLFYRSISPDDERHLVRHHCPLENTAKRLPAKTPIHYLKHLLFLLQPREQ